MKLTKPQIQSLAAGFPVKSKKGKIYKHHNAKRPAASKKELPPIEKIEEKEEEKSIFFQF